MSDHTLIYAPTPEAFVPRPIEYDDVHPEWTENAPVYYARKGAAVGPTVCMGRIILHKPRSIGMTDIFYMAHKPTSTSRGSKSAAEDFSVKEEIKKVVTDCLRLRAENEGLVASNGSIQEALSSKEAQFWEEQFSAMLKMTSDWNDNGGKVYSAEKRAEYCAIFASHALAARRNEFKVGAKPPVAPAA